MTSTHTPSTAYTLLGPWAEDNGTEGLRAVWVLHSAFLLAESVLGDARMG